MPYLLVAGIIITVAHQETAEVRQRLWTQGAKM